MQRVRFRGIFFQRWNISLSHCSFFSLERAFHIYISLQLTVTLHRLCHISPQEAKADSESLQVKVWLAPSKPAVYANMDCEKTFDRNHWNRTKFNDECKINEHVKLCILTQRRLETPDWTEPLHTMYTVHVSSVWLQGWSLVFANIANIRHFPTWDSMRSEEEAKHLERQWAEFSLSYRKFIATATYFINIYFSSQHENKSELMKVENVSGFLHIIML